MTSNPSNASELGERVSTRPATVDEGLPPTQADWPEGVAQRLAELSQGTVVREPPLFYYANPARAVWARTRVYTADSVGPEVIEVEEGNSPSYGIITSQTCDVVEEGKGQPILPWVQVAPVYDRSDLNSGLRKLLRNGSGPQHLYYLPALPDGFWVADLRIEVPIEKGWFVDCVSAPGFTSDEQRRKFGERLAARRSRPALAGVVVENIQQPLGSLLKELKRDESEFYGRMDSQIDEVAIRCSDHLNPSTVGLTVIAQAPVDDDVREWWGAWWDETREKAEVAAINLLPLEIRAPEDITLAEYKRMTTMPLERVSPE